MVRLVSYFVNIFRKIFVLFRFNDLELKCFRKGKFVNTKKTDYVFVCKVLISLMS